MKDFELEKTKLENTVKDIKRIIKLENAELEELFDSFIGNKDELWRYVERKKVHIANLETSQDNPYFARIDFTSDDDKKSNVIYIGKNGVIDDKNDIIVTDWRAPISSLYYNSEIGNCSYLSPDGIIRGSLDLKRQFEIKDGELQEYFDVDLVSNDALLQKYLNDNNDNRLKTIVSTIQKEQNDVIRQALNDNLIVQGVAGSGKTTVALHRIAYLVYNYINSIKQEQYLVIGPNPVFLKYIQSVLPELDVTGVQQLTYENFARNYIGEDVEINNSDKKININISGSQTNDVDKFKCSLRYKEMLDAFIAEYINEMTNADLMIDDYVVFSKEHIRKIFDSLSDNMSLKNKIELTIDKLAGIIESNRDDFLVDYSRHIYNKFNSAKDKDAVRKQASKAREEINKNCRTILKKYFSKVKVSPTKLYKQFVGDIEKYDVKSYEHLAELKKETLANVKKNKYDFEDLAALLYLKSCVNPEFDYRNIKHVVVDEAQDFGEFNFVSLKSCLPNSSFSIFGDIVQSIYDYRSIDNWNEVNNCMFDNNGKIITFDKSYRTTSEIMNVANNVSESLNLGSSKDVIRHGKPVEFTKADDSGDIPSIILKKIEEYKAAGYKSIAVISKTELLSKYINDDLADLGLVVPNVNFSDDLNDDKFSVCTISNQLSKGLEFDAVIINNASESIYSSESSLDMKLLYVAITRALHEVSIVYDGELTHALNEYEHKEELTKKRV